MDDAFLVRRLERVGDLSRDARAPRRAAAARRDPFRQRLALDQLQHEGAHAVGLFEAVDRRDVRVVERRQHPRLALEARQPLGIRW